MARNQEYVLVPRTLSNLARCLIGVWMDSSPADVFERAAQRFHDIDNVSYRLPAFKPGKKI